MRGRVGDRTDCTLTKPDGNWGGAAAGQLASLEKAVRLALHVDNLFDERYFFSAQVNTRNLDMTGANQVGDFYGLSGEPAAVFGSIGLYF